MDFYGLLIVFLTAAASTAEETMSCTGIRTIRSSPATHTGHIVSPKHPSSYPAENMQCTFKFLPNPDEQVQLAFSYFNLRESQQVPANLNCDLSDSVKLFIGTSRANSDPGNQIGEYCGKKHPEIVMAVGRPLTVLFTIRTKENPHISAIYKFKAKYTFMKDYGSGSKAHQNRTAGCHFVYDGRTIEKGNFTSPNFGGLYPFATNCLYTFKAFGNQSIRLNFHKFEIDGQHDCRRSDDDMLQIIESDYNWQNFAISAEEDPAKRETNSTLYCGFKSPVEFNTHKQTVNVIFKSGQLRTKQGFKGTFTFVGHPGVYLPLSSSSFTLRAVPMVTFCLWTIFLKAISF